MTIVSGLLGLFKKIVGKDNSPKVSSKTEEVKKSGVTTTTTTTTTVDEMGAQKTVTVTKKVITRAKANTNVIALCLSELADEGKKIPAKKFIKFLLPRNILGNEIEKFFCSKNISIFKKNLGIIKFI